MAIQRMILAAGMACLLAACSPPAQQGPASASAARGIQPGQYRSTVTMLEMNLPGIESQGVDTTPTVSENCVTSSDIVNFAEGSTAGGNSGETCAQNSMTVADGRIHGETSCTGPNGTRTLQIDGTYSPTRIDMEISSNTDMPGVGASTMRMRMASERIGDCPAGTETD